MTGERIQPEKLPITEGLLDLIDFKHRIIGRNEDGTLKTIPSIKGDWFLRDTIMNGFCIRVTAKKLRFLRSR